MASGPEDRFATDPESVTSRSNSSVGPTPIEELVYTRTATSAVRLNVSSVCPGWPAVWQHNSGVCAIPPEVSRTDHARYLLVGSVSLLLNYLGSHKRFVSRRKQIPTGWMIFTRGSARPRVSVTLQPAPEIIYRKPARRVTGCKPRYPHLAPRATRAGLLVPIGAHR